MKQFRLGDGDGIGLENKKGAIREGLDADLIIWNEDLSISKVLTARDLDELTIT